MEKLNRIEEKLKEIDMPLCRKIERNLKNWGEGTMSEYLAEAKKAFDIYDQGSLSFTVTAMRHKGYGYPYSILAAIDETK